MYMVKYIAWNTHVSVFLPKEFIDVELCAHMTLGLEINLFQRKPNSGFFGIRYVMRCYDIGKFVICKTFHF